MRLFEITDDMRQLQELAMNADSPEEIEAIQTTLDALKEMELEPKARGIALVLESLSPDVDALVAMKERIDKRIKAIENNAKRLRSYLATNMEAAGIKKIELKDPETGAKFGQISLVPGRTRVVILDESKLPDDLVQSEVVTKPKTVEIKAKLEAYEKLKPRMADLLKKDKLTPDEDKELNMLMVEPVPGAELQRGDSYVRIS